MLVARLIHLLMYLLVPVLSFLLPVWAAGFLRDDTLSWLSWLPVISLLTTLLLVSTLLVVFVWLVQRLDDFVRRLVGRVVQPDLERAGFDLFAALSARERGFRSRVYPMLVLPFVMFVWMALDPSQMGSQVYIWSSLIPLLYAILILHEVRHSDTPEASWVFAAAPAERHGLGEQLGALEVATLLILPVIVWQLKVLRSLEVDPRSIPPVT